jgi:hypothetical protein
MPRRHWCGAAGPDTGYFGWRACCLCTRAVWKVRGLTLLLRVGTLWRCGDGLSSKYLPWQAIHFLQRSTHFSKTCLRPFAASFRWIVEQEVLTSWSLRARSSLFMVSLRLHRLDGWVVGFLVHFLQAEHRIQSRNAPLRKYLSCSAILERGLLKRP